MKALSSPGNAEADPPEVQIVRDSGLCPRVSSIVLAVRGVSGLDGGWVTRLVPWMLSAAETSQRVLIQKLTADQSLVFRFRLVVTPTFK